MTGANPLPSESQRSWFQSTVIEWGESNLRSFPWRRDETPYRILIAELMLTQTPAERVSDTYPDFVEKFPGLDALAEASVGELTGELRSLGFQNRRAKALHDIGTRLENEGIPREESQLMDLPYVGKYGANAVLCFGHGVDRPIVDRNVVRIFNRVFSAEIGSPESNDAWSYAETLLPPNRVREYNLSLLDLGALVCTSRDPTCSECWLQEKCDTGRRRA